MVSPFNNPGAAMVIGWSNYPGIQRSILEGRSVSAFSLVPQKDLVAVRLGVIIPGKKFPRAVANTATNPQHPPTSNRLTESNPLKIKRSSGTCKLPSLLAMGGLCIEQERVGNLAARHGGGGLCGLSSPFMWPYALRLELILFWYSLRQ